VVHGTIPAAKLGQAAFDARAGATLGRILEETKPEAAIFCTQNGEQGGFLITPMKGVSEVPKFAEPWFLNFDAAVEFLPALTPEDLKNVGVDALAKKWK
jgi:hypothetical protein